MTSRFYFDAGGTALMRTEFAAWVLGASLAACGVACGSESTAARPVGAPSAVASSGSPSSSGPVASANGAPEMAPTPYTAEQLRASNGAGTLYRYKVETAGEPTQITVMEFTKGTSAESAEVKNELLDESGKAAGPAKVGKASWEELRHHGEFPRAALKVEPGSIEVPAGKFDAMVYTVSAPNGETMRLYFAKSYAGPPVLFYKERAGVRLTTSTLLERRAAN